MLTPEAYVESMRRMVECIPVAPNSILLDVGCGSGSIIKHLKSSICERTYVGMDLLFEGLAGARIKAGIENISNILLITKSLYNFYFHILLNE